MKIQAKLSDNRQVMTIKISGKSEYQSIEALQAIYQQLDERVITVILELTNANTVGSLIIGEFVRMSEYLTKKHIELEISNPSQMNLSLFKMTNLIDHVIDPD